MLALNPTRLAINPTFATLKVEEGSNTSIFCASIMPSFLKTLITKNLNLKIQNKTVGYELYHFIYAHVKNYGISTFFFIVILSL